MGLGIPPLKINIMLESNPLKSIMLVQRLTETYQVGAHRVFEVALSDRGSLSDSMYAVLLLAYLEGGDGWGGRVFRNTQEHYSQSD